VCLDKSSRGDLHLLLQETQLTTANLDDDYDDYDDNNDDHHHAVHRPMGKLIPYIIHHSHHSVLSSDYRNAFSF